MHRSCTASRSSRPLVALALSLASSCAFADPSPALDRVSIWLGGYYANSDLAINASDAGNHVSTGKVNLESGSETVGRARLDVLFLDSQGFSFDYYTLDHASNKTLSKPFSYEGDDYRIGSNLRGKLDFTAASASYHFWFGGDNDVFGIGLGATYYQVKLGIDGTLAVGDEQASASARWKEDAIAPMLSVAYKHAFSDNLRVYADASGVRKNGGNLSGHLYDARVGVEWFPWHNVGLGAEYGATRIRVERDASRYNADLDVDLDGPSLFARFRF